MLLRVSSISPGMVETEFTMVSQYGNKESAESFYNKFKCLEAEDIANAVLYILSTPAHVEVNDVLIRPTAQTS